MRPNRKMDSVSTCGMWLCSSGLKTMRLVATIPAHSPPSRVAQRHSSSTLARNSTLLASWVRTGSAPQAAAHA